MVHRSWEGIAEIMRAHFIKLLGTKVPLDEASLQEVLQAQTEGIPPIACEDMEKLILLEELHSAAKALAKQKVLGEDDLPVEFFLALWDKLGPLLFQVLQSNINKGSLHQQLTEGIMVMLEKRGDQTLIGNK